MSEQATCELCGEPMPLGEEMFKFHGYSCPCPKQPLPDMPFASEPAETAYQRAKELGISITRDQLRPIIQAYQLAQDKSRQEYEKWKEEKAK